MKKLICSFLAAFTALSLNAFTGCNKKTDPDDEKFVNAVSYSDFGAVGDGKTDDFEALKKAHTYANENKLPVKADSGKKYYIGAVEDSITVKTNVDWSGASFIIDDKIAETDSNVWRYPLFSVEPETQPCDIEIPSGYSLKAGQKDVATSFEKPCLLAIYNDEKKDFIRYGNYNSEGWSRQEIILVDKNGKVDETTPIQWDYEKVTKMTAYSVTEEPLLLRGGSFTTIANDDPVSRYYFERGIMVERSNVTVKNVSHKVTSEGDMGSPYNGFFRTKFANNVEYEKCEVTGHKYYNQGNYDIRPLSSNDVRYINCTQLNDITDDKLWGVMCSDYCKNLYMDGCKVSRFDAHQGVYNATIKNSDIGQHISVTGGGTLLVENVVTYAKKGTWYNRFVTLRSDYGSFFYGDVIIKDCTMYTERGINYVLAADWYDWDFGYECRYPKTVTIDNVQLITDTEEWDHGCLYIFSQQYKGTTYGDALNSKNPPVLTEKVIIKNNIDPATGEQKTAFKMTLGEGGWFASTVIEYVP